jgi:polyisoprenoid-binding protein YceI
MGLNEHVPETETEIRYVTDARASLFTAQVSSGGLLSAFGHNPTIAIRDFVGEVEVDLDEIERSWLKVTIQAAKLSVQNDISDKDREEIERTMREEILETSSYPEIVYESSSVAANKTGEGRYTATVNGDLTMHGVTRPQSVTARVVLEGDTLRAFGNFSVMQTDYELKLASVAGGALKVKNEVKFSFNILARRKE